MSKIKSLSVGYGDMFYVVHNSDNFSIIDCCMPADRQDEILDEISSESKPKGCVRFISTHPDEDHLKGLKALDERLNLTNFYCAANAATKEDETDDFKHYCEKRDGEKAFHVYRDCSRRWMNKSDDTRDTAGINIIWPVTSNERYKDALEEAEEGGSPNNISTVIRYSAKDSGSAMWMGDLETEFMENIADAIKWPKTTIVFAPHHGRDSGRIPHAILDQLKPKIIVLGEAPSRHMHYYGDYHTLTQNSAGDLLFEYIDNNIHIYCSNADYEADFLDYDEAAELDGWNYLGTLNL